MLQSPNRNIENNSQDELYLLVKIVQRNHSKIT